MAVAGIAALGISGVLLLEDASAVFAPVIAWSGASRRPRWPVTSG
jgi:hypothetical protein